MLFPPNRRRQPGRRTERGFIHAVVEMKQRNPNWGAPRVAQQLACALAFHVPIDKNVVRRILARHYRQDSGGPSWLTFLGYRKDSLWSANLFRHVILQGHSIAAVSGQP